MKRSEVLKGEISIVLYRHLPISRLEQTYALQMAGNGFLSGRPLGAVGRVKQAQRRYSNLEKICKHPCGEERESIKQITLLIRDFNFSFLIFRISCRKDLSNKTFTISGM
jgi:hypothetical protein